MGCVNRGKCCPYSTWFEQRVDIILATIKYLETKIAEVESFISKLSEDELEGDPIYPIENNSFDALEFQSNISELKKYLIDPIHKTTKKEQIYNILIACNKRCGIKDGLVSFGVYGVYLLCDQSDCNGVYTVGESHDILELLETIEPSIDKESEIYRAAYIDNKDSSSIISVFRDSVNTRQPIKIT